MPKSSLALKATVTRRQAEPVPSEMAERLEQLRHHQAVENATVRPNEAATALEPEKPGKDKRQAHALQAMFLTGNLGKPVTVVMINGVKVTGKLCQFDQFTVLLQSLDGLNSLIFKHALATIAPASDIPGKQR